MNCAQCQDFINAYLDGELGERLRAEVESHLSSCSDCGCDVANWEACLDWLRRAFPEQMAPVELWEKVRASTETG